MEAGNTATSTNAISGPILGRLVDGLGCTARRVECQWGMGLSGAEQAHQHSGVTSSGSGLPEVPSSSQGCGDQTTLRQFYHSGSPQEGGGHLSAGSGRFVTPWLIVGLAYMYPPASLWPRSSGCWRWLCFLQFQSPGRSGRCSSIFVRRTSREYTSLLTCSSWGQGCCRAGGCCHAREAGWVRSLQLCARRTSISKWWSTPNNLIEILRRGFLTASGLFRALSLQSAVRYSVGDFTLSSLRLLEGYDAGYGEGSSCGHFVSS